MLLDGVLEFGPHLPVLDLILEWVSPRSWVQFQCLKRSFRVFLEADTLRRLAFNWPLISNSIHGVIDTTTNHSTPAYFSASPLQVSIWQQTPTEVAQCEAVFIAWLRGLDVNEAQPTTGITPLMQAAEEGRWRLSCLLLACKADPNRTSIGGATALSLALSPSCSRCMTSTKPVWCSCPRPSVADVLVHRTKAGLPAALVAGVRMALQDVRYLPLVSALIQDKQLPVDMELFGPDSRRGTALSVALEQQVHPVEKPIVNRPLLVATLLELRADPARPGPYVAWCGRRSSQGLVGFAAANHCDLVTLELLHART